MTWVQINERLLAIERGDKKEGWEKEWNSLLDMSSKIAGILKRDKYEIPEGKKEGKGRAKEGGKGKDVATIQPDMVGENTS